MLIHLVDATQEDVAGAYETVREELEAYGEGLADKPEIVALNKVDALGLDERKAKVKALKKASGQTPVLVSGVSGEGVRDLLRAALRQIRGPETEKDAPDAPWAPSQ